VVVGGGGVAERKIDSLLACDAEVCAIAPSFSPTVERLAAEGKVALVRRSYRPGDLAGCFLAVAATDDEEVNEAVWREAEERGLLVNVVDDPARCTFTLPATLRRGPFLLTVSTGGTSPALARRVREELERQFGPEYGVFATWLGELRGRLRASHTRQEERERIYRALVYSDVLDLLRAGRETEARQRVEALLQEPPASG